MTDQLDDMFANDLNKLSMPSELAMNAAKVKAAQTDKPGAEKPDLYAKGKGKGKGGKPAKDEENDERKSKGPNKGEKKDPNAPDKQQGAKSKDDLDKEAGRRDVMREILGSGNQAKAREALAKKLRAAAAKGAAGGALVAAPVAGVVAYKAGKKKGQEKTAAEDERAFTATRYYKKRFLRPGMKEVRRTMAIRGKLPAGVPVPKPEPEMKKKSSLDEEFNADMRQIVGVEPMDKEASWERHDVSVEGQTTDRIDDHFIGWMQEKADEDVVKEASIQRHAKAIREAEKKAELDKEAGVQQNPENLDLLARIRKSAEQKAGFLLAGTGDV